MRASRERLIRDKAVKEIEWIWIKRLVYGTFIAIGVAMIVAFIIRAI